MLNVQKRHQAPCKRAEWDQRSCKGKGADCPVLIIGTLNGKRVRLSTAKFLPRDQAKDLEAGRQLALLWEQAGAPVRPDGHMAPASQPETDTPRPTVEAAVAAFMADSKDRNNSESTLYKKTVIFEKLLKRFCDAKGIRFLSELDLNTLREWRGTWNVNSLVRRKRQGQVLGFIWFCERSGWFPRNYAADITKGLGKIQVKATQTGYFMPAEYKALLDATYIYSDRPSVDAHNSLTIGGDRIRALTELIRWTGLRIRDAVTLEKSRLEFDAPIGLWRVMVYQKKTGDPVYCPIPPRVAELLRSVPASQKGNTNERYFFWTGQGKPKTIVSNWQRSYVKLFKLAAIKEADGRAKRCHPHMLRDTFAVEALLCGMRLENVSTILGHSSVKTTERHYMPWVRARQTSLNQSVVQSWIAQGIVKGPEQKRARITKAPVSLLPAPAAPMTEDLESVR